MTKDVQICEEGDLVISAVKKMAEFNIGSLIVVKNGKPVGIFTERDLVIKVIAQGLDPANLSVEKVMSIKLITIAASESVGYAYHILIKENVRHAPVIEDDKLVGIVSQKDLARVIDERFSVTYYGKYGKRDFSGRY